MMFIVGVVWWDSRRQEVGGVLEEGGAGWSAGVLVVVVRRVCRVVGK